MNEIKLINIDTPVPADKVAELLFELQCAYHELASAAKAYNVMTDAVHDATFSSRSMARLILDGAHGRRDAETARLLNHIFHLLRDFFKPIEHSPEE